MKIVKVTYTTQPGFADTNKVNITAVMSELRGLKNPGINYNVCLCPDDKTFIHTAYFESEADQKVLFDLQSFKTFQEQLKGSNPEVGPKQELLTIVGSSKDFFG